jgi:hypothetical protein
MRRPSDRGSGEEGHEERRGRQPQAEGPGQGGELERRHRHPGQPQRASFEGGQDLGLERAVEEEDHLEEREDDRRAGLPGHPVEEGRGGDQQQLVGLEDGGERHLARLPADLVEPPRDEKDPAEDAQGTEEIQRVVADEPAMQQLSILSAHDASVGCLRLRFGAANIRRPSGGVYGRATRDVW